MTVAGLPQDANPRPEDSPGQLPLSLDLVECRFIGEHWGWRGLEKRHGKLRVIWGSPGRVRWGLEATSTREEMPNPLFRGHCQLSGQETQLSPSSLGLFHPLKHSSLLPLSGSVLGAMTTG